jgi:D-glycero-D-manno-heptose 1,7-bisphosphate phosphatase
MGPDQKRPAIFVDRDGTLVEEVNFLARVEDLKVFPFAEAALRSLRAAGFSIVVVTNQSGIGRGIFSEADMHAVNREIGNRLPGLLDAFYFCPHLPDDGCRCRKPNIGMIEDAIKDMNIDINNSWMIGDKEIDILAGVNAGIKTAMVRTGYGDAHAQQLAHQPDIVANDLCDASRRICAMWKGK